LANEIAKLFVTISADTSGFNKGVKGMQQQLKVIGTAMTAAGAAGLKLVDSAREINSHLATTAVTVGATTDELRGMVLEVANVTFGIDSVTKTFDILAKAGMRNQEEMQATATAFDTLGDATFSSAEAVADILVPAFKVFGKELPKTADELDTFTWLVTNTTIDLAEFGAVMSYVAMYGADLGLEVNDLIAILAALEDRGIGGAEATRLFRTAVKQAADGVAPFNEILGVSQTQIEGYKSEMNDATGLTQQYADAANTQYGIMDKLKFLWSRLTFQLGSFLTPLEPILAGMTAMGPVMIFLGSATGRSALAFIANAAATMKSHIATALHTGSSATLAGTQTAVAGATGKAAVAQVGLNRAMMANPIIAIIAGFVALGFALKHLWENWERISIQMDQVWLKMRNTVAGGLPTYQAEMDLFNLELAWQELAKAVKDSQEQIVSDVKMATDHAISEAGRLAKQEKRILDDRAAYYRDKHYEKMELIDKEMMAELRAIDPVLAAQVEGYNQEIEGLDKRRQAREDEAEDDRLAALEKERRDSDTSQQRKEALDREIAEIEDARNREHIIEERNLAISGAAFETYFEGQKTLVDKQLSTQLETYNADLAAFKALNHDKLVDLKAYVDTYNKIVGSTGMPGMEFEIPEGPVPEQRTTPGWTPPLLIPTNTRKWAAGGTITEPTLLYGLNSHQPYALAGEAGIEHVVPDGQMGGNTYNTYKVNINNPVVREDSDIKKLSQQVGIELGRISGRRMRMAGL